MWSIYIWCMMHEDSNFQYILFGFSYSVRSSLDDHCVVTQSSFYGDVNVFIFPMFVERVKCRFFLLFFIINIVFNLSTYAIWKTTVKRWLSIWKKTKIKRHELMKPCNNHGITMYPLQHLHTLIAFDDHFDQAFAID